MSDVSDVRDTIVPKSDQLNADDLIAGSITVTVTAVRRGAADEQPIIVEISGGYHPYKPCKTMRRMLVAAWGKDASQWVGRSLELYRDDSVKFAGEAVGGIRISRMSHLDKALTLKLSATRGKRAAVTVEPLRTAGAAGGKGCSDEWLQKHMDSIRTAMRTDELGVIIARIEMKVGPINEEQRAMLATAHDAVQVMEALPEEEREVLWQAARDYAAEHGCSTDRGVLEASKR